MLTTYWLDSQGISQLVISGAELISWFELFKPKHWIVTLLDSSMILLDTITRRFDRRFSLINGRTWTPRCVWFRRWLGILSAIEALQRHGIRACISDATEQLVRRCRRELEIVEGCTWTFVETAVGVPAIERSIAKRSSMFSLGSRRRQAVWDGHCRSHQ